MGNKRIECKTKLVGYCAFFIRDRERQQIFQLKNQNSLTQLSQLCNSCVKFETLYSILMKSTFKGGFACSIYKDYSRVIQTYNTN